MPVRPSRRELLTAAAALAAASCSPSAGPSAVPRAPVANPFAADFDDLWVFGRDTYCFFGEKATDWDRVRAVYRPRAAAVATPSALADVIDDALAELYDPHCHVNGDARDGARRFVPADLWAEMRDGRAIVTAVRTDSMASYASVRPGAEVVTLDGAPIEGAVRASMPRCLTRDDPAASAWALLAALSGRLMKPRALGLRAPSGAARDASLVPNPSASNEPDPPPVVFRREGAFGYIRVSTFGDESVVGLFDHAIAELRDTPGLVIDVRENGGGDTAYARPMMGRFLKTRAPYAYMARREGGARALGPQWAEYVEPRGPFTYEAKVVVLVDRFSASMAEGFPMGMRGIGRAKVVGTKMAGLGAAIQRMTLAHSKLDVQISAEPVYDVQRQPRSQMVPDVEVRLEQVASSDGSDAILAAGLAALSG